MNMKRITFFVLAVLALTGSAVSPADEMEAADFVLGADSASPQTIVIGASDPNTEDTEEGFKLQLVLSSKGASIKKATFSNGGGKGFDDRAPKNPRPLVLLKPVEYAGRQIMSMANNQFIFVDRKLQLRLNELHWECLGVETTPNGCQKATFTAVIKNQATDKSVIKLTKTYALPRSSYTATCNLTVENLSDAEQNIRFNLTGPVGPQREGVRADMRKLIGGFQNAEGQIVSAKVDLKELRKSDERDDLRLKSDNNKMLWASAVNKYFAAITAFASPKGQQQWVAGVYGESFNPDNDSRFNSGDETIGFEIKTRTNTLAPAGQQNSSKQYDMELYLGPKDRDLFNKVEHYRRLGFYHTIDFITCCCPAAIIQPLAFGILWLMKAIYAGIPNYGVVIIILVFVVRLLLHPITKMGQVRMNRFTKLLSSPEIQEIKKKYAKNQMEMQKRIAAYQKEKGISPLEPIMGMLPMMIQMPLWIALWSAVNASVDLRGAEFLPFWITDLSSPDALFRFPAVYIPLLGKINSFNLLPILMGVAFYVQQKMMPQQPSATPEQQQQQKIMKVMMLIMFPLLLYQAPSGVSLYIMASTFAGAIEQHFIKKHIAEQEEAEKQRLVEVTSKTGGKAKKKKPKPFFKQYS